jgi:hypothetical protein
LLILVAFGALIGVGTYILIGDSSSAAAGVVSLAEDPTWKIVIAIICYLLALIILIAMCCFRSRLALASKVVEVAAVFVAGNCGIVLVPFIMFIVTVIFVALWIL